MRKLNVFIDGSCINSTDKEKAIGGWSYIITDEHFNIINQDFGKLRIGNQDSVRAELEALNQALIHMKTIKDCKFHIYADYKCIVDSIKGFSKRIANREFWDSIEPLCIRLAGTFDISHIHSHDKNPKEDKILRDLNKEADMLARAGANSLVKVPVAV